MGNSQHRGESPSAENSIRLLRMLRCSQAGLRQLQCLELHFRAVKTMLWQALGQGPTSSLVFDAPMTAQCCWKASSAIVMVHYMAFFTTFCTHPGAQK